MWQQEEEFQQIQKKQSKSSLRSKAVHFVSDLTTLLLNPISDRTSYTPPNGQPSSHDDLDISELCQSDSEEHSRDSVDGPDTSSFTTFMYSLLASGPETRENSKKNSLLSKGKQSLNYEAATLGGFRNQSATFGNGSSNSDEGIPIQTFNESLPSENLPETSEPSLLLSEKTRSVLYTALPVIVHGQKWILIYSTFRHGISLLTLYRRSMLCPGFSLLVVGDRKGAVFGGLVEAPLRPTNKRRYQGTNNSFVFTNVSGHAMIFSPTGINRYFTLCSTEYLALGGGDHFALYLDGDLTNGSSSSSETYGNPCLARSDDFQVKEIELWGFVFDSKYEEIIASLCTEPPGICH